MATYSAYNDRRDDRRQYPIRAAYQDDRADYDDYADRARDRPRTAQMGPQRSRATRTFRRGDNIITEEIFQTRGRGPMPDDVKMAMVRRQRDDDVEEIPRDFPPPLSAPIRRARSPRREPPRNYRQRDDYYEDDERSQYSRHTRRDRSRSPSRSPSPDRRRSERGRRDEPLSDAENEPKDKKKSAVDNVLEGLGFGGAAAGVKKLFGQKDKEKDKEGGDRNRGSRHDSSDSEDERSDGKKKSANARRHWTQAAQAAVIAGAVEAFRSRNEPGTWTGAKGVRAATAGLSAAGIDGFVERGGDNGHSKRHLVEAVIGGLAANRLVNGKRDKGEGFYDEETGDYIPARTPRSQSIMSRGISRMRSMSRGRGRRGSESSFSDEDGGRPQERGRGKSTVKQLAGAGALAALGKTVFDRVRSKSRKRKDSESRSRSRSISRSRSRSRGVRDHSRSHSRSSSRSSRSSFSDDDRPRQRGGQEDRNVFGRAVAPVAVGAGAGALATSSRRGGYEPNSHNAYVDDTSDDEGIVNLEAEGKRMRGKELLTAGLATVATIHAANGVYSSMVAHEKRHKMVDAGTMTPAEARKKQTRAWIQDAAAVGIAALGIKGAFSEWKNMSEQRSVISHPALKVYFFVLLKVAQEPYQRARAQKEEERGTQEEARG